MNVEKLKVLLQDAQAAYESQPVQDWAPFYAKFMAEKIAAEAHERPKTEGHHENERNERNRDLYADMIREAHGVDQVIIGHHLVYVDVITGADNFVYHIPAEIPSADALIFDHVEARRIWGEDRFKDVLVKLVLEPVETRDDLLRELYYSR